MECLFSTAIRPACSEVHCAGDTQKPANSVLLATDRSRIAEFNEMKLKLAIAFVMLVSSISVAAQSASRNEHIREQTDFGAEDTFERPVPLPPAALQAIRDAKGADTLLEMCAESEGIRVAEIPATWFAGSEIRLSRVPGSGLVVRGENTCLSGAHIVQFWILAKSAATYKVVFAGRADALEVLPTRSNGYRDLQLVFITQAGVYVDYVNLRYSDGAYHKSGHRLTHPN